MKSEKLISQNEKKGMSRRALLINTSKYALGAAVGVAGLELIRENKAYGENRQFAGLFSDKNEYTGKIVLLKRLMRNSTAIFYS